MFPDDFKQGLRKMTMEIFDQYEMFVVNATGLENRLIPDVSGSLFLLTAPVTIGSELKQFYIDEGLNVTAMGTTAFTVSLVC